MVKGFGFRVRGLWLRFKGFGYRIQGSESLGLIASRIGFRV
jgi:hypothetical protein